MCCGADFKGQFKTGDGRKCYPLTMSDNYSRYLLVCQCCSGVGSDAVQRIYRRGFEEYGVPDAIRTDNGWPFAASSLGGLGPLGVWLVKLDVMPEWIKPGCPQQNGRHERMHRTLKEATAMPPAGNARAQQRAFNRCRREYNEQRPHHSLKLGQCPGDVYQPSPRRYREQFRRGIQYPAHLQVRQVRHCGSIKWRGREIYLNRWLKGEPVGLEEIGPGRWLLYFGRLPLGVIDQRLPKIQRPV